MRHDEFSHLSAAAAGAGCCRGSLSPAAAAGQVPAAPEAARLQSGCMLVVLCSMTRSTSVLFGLMVRTVGACIPNSHCPAVQLRAGVRELQECLHEVAWMRQVMQIRPCLLYLALQPPPGLGLQPSAASHPPARLNVQLQEIATIGAKTVLSPNTFSCARLMQQQMYP